MTVTASGATGSPRAIPVTFTVDPPPQPPVLAVSSSTLAFSATAGAPTVETKALNVTNTRRRDAELHRLRRRAVAEP